MKGHITEKELKYFSYEFKKSCNLGKLYLLLKIHKSLENVPGRPVISNCGTPTEKVPEFLDHHHPSIPHQAGLIALKKTLDKSLSKKIPTDNLIKMAEFVLSNNFFEFNNCTFQQISGMAIGTKFAPPYACITWIKLNRNGEKELEKFMSSFNSLTPNCKFTYGSSKKDISFLDLKVSLTKGKLLSTDLYIKPTDRHQYLHYSSGHPEHTKRSVVYCQLLRVSQICSCENDFNQHKSNMKIWFQK